MPKASQACVAVSTSSESIGTMSMRGFVQPKIEVVDRPLIATRDQDHSGLEQAGGRQQADLAPRAVPHMRVGFSGSE